jgi:ParB/RepB/Spo0J family partition protein
MAVEKSKAKEEKKKRGRRAGTQNKPKPPEKHVEMGTVVKVDLFDIDLQDEDFRFRAKLLFNDLVESIGEQGLQVPVILRPTKGDSKVKYQVISGFRRINAIKKLGWKQVDSIVRKDLDNDIEAFRVSIIENEARKTYNDLDRANAILAYRRFGKSNAEIEDIFKIGERQRQRLQELTQLPEELQEAIIDEKVASTHAVRLMQHKRKFPDTNLLDWIQRIVDENMGYNELNRQLKAEAEQKSEEKPVELFASKGEGKARIVRVRPIAIVDRMSSEQLVEVQKQLKELSQFVDSLIEK